MNPNDKIEFAYSFDDHILDHLDTSSNIPYIRYCRKNDFEIEFSNLDADKKNEIDLIVKDILLFSLLFVIVSILIDKIRIFIFKFLRINELCELTYSKTEKIVSKIAKIM